MKKGKILIVLVIAALMLLPACDSGKQEINVVHDGGSDFPLDKVSPEWDNVKMGMLTPYDNIEEFKNREDGKTYDTLLGGNSMPLAKMERLQNAHLVVTGIVLGFTFNPEDGIYPTTIYHILPSEVFRGAAKTDEDGLVHIRSGGGQTKTHMFDCDATYPGLTVGKEYLFFLFDPILYGEGEGTNNVGFYEYGQDCVGLCTVSEENGVEYYVPYFENAFADDFTGGKISHDDFKAMMDEINATVPVQTESEMRKEYVDRWRYTIDVYVTDGRMTQEEYDEAKAWLDAYEFYTGE